MPPLTQEHSVPRLTRREALQAFAASVALSAAGCSKPDETILPAVTPSGSAAPGEPQRFATCLPLAGYGRGVVAISVDGRPIKLEGNARHPGSLGATDVFAEADVLSLYDPDRSRAPRRAGAPATYEELLAVWQGWRAAAPASGKSLRLLTGRITSPTRLRLIAKLLSDVPGSVWHAYEPTDDPARQSARLAFGRALMAVPHLDRADVILCLDADPLGPGPDQLRLSRGWAARRREQAGLSRVFVMESTLSLTGAKADERLAVHPSALHDAVLVLARALGADVPEATLPPAAGRFLAAALAALQNARGRAVVLPGRTLTPEAASLVHWINQALDAPIDWVESPERAGDTEPSDLEALRRDLEAGRVGALVIAGVNPAYDRPDLELQRHTPGLALSVQHGSWFDETAELCGWHVPAHHPLEAWSDLRAVDGSAAIAQPLIRPLYDTVATETFLAMLDGRTDASDHALVRETWLPGWGDDAEGVWRKALADGVVAGSASPPFQDLRAAVPGIAPAGDAGKGWTLVLLPHHSTFDGSRANNPWLQECPAPFGKQVWGNALHVSPADAARAGLADGDVVRLAAGRAELDVPVQVLPGQAPGVLGLAVGQGRRKAGAVGSGVGVDAFPLKPTDGPWAVPRVHLDKTGRSQEILATQNDVRLSGTREDLYPLLTPGHTVEPSRAKPAPADFYPDYSYNGPAWAMVIDTAVCSGCNACVVACQAENNVPVVGPEEIARGRVMHWLRVDVYDHGDADAPRPGFQPVPCMHCEKAPCEPVCPVAASVHDAEGLNVQVYNRCVGTRFCEANCPYKVRRFNFFGYADGQEYANLGAETLKAQKNPEVTVRARGVMEKCTYCIQRIARARQTAEREGREGGELAVTTACQQACPTSAITFGDLHGRESAVAALRGDPRHYALLGHLNTKPRTTYLADLRNPDPALKEGT